MSDLAPFLTRLVPHLAEVSGVAGIVLGGSRARGTAIEMSDYDIGLYYCRDEALDTEHLLATVRDLVDDPDAAAVTAVGEWGPRIVGGGWLRIQGRKVDLLYRSVDDVRAVIAECCEGRISMAYQPGHPHGFCSAIWMGEVALCRPLHDPQGTIAALKAATLAYPDALRSALIRTFLWEVPFSIDNAQLAIPRRDRAHIAGCFYRALGCIGQVLFALNRRYLINEKGALIEAAGFPDTIEGLAERVDAVWGALGTSEFMPALDILRALDEELRGLVRIALGSRLDQDGCV
ncbi:nucleotidyltransferase domain-containing protein [Microvirga sp. Mcv34]|uniref:nucleotidyltransferase domain-containing protein n=1 Tax=Microvirga sp. Mcv34 TaxID=2926016 RepID=UPI0021C8FB31|nr:nucleotidyltransferase domain-containing protein [Microvirga sp. Mcv34]